MTIHTHIHQNYCQLCDFVKKMNDFHSQYAANRIQFLLLLMASTSTYKIFGIYCLESDLRSTFKRLITSLLCVYVFNTINFRHIETLFTPMKTHIEKLLSSKMFTLMVLFGERTWRKEFVSLLFLFFHRHCVLSRLHQVKLCISHLHLMECDFTCLFSPSSISVKFLFSSWYFTCFVITPMHTKRSRKSSNLIESQWT